MLNKNILRKNCLNFFYLRTKKTSLFFGTSERSAPFFCFFFVGEKEIFFYLVYFVKGKNWYLPSPPFNKIVLTMFGIWRTPFFLPKKFSHCFLGRERVYFFVFYFVLSLFDRPSAKNDFPFFAGYLFLLLYIFFSFMYIFKRACVWHFFISSLPLFKYNLR